MKVNNVDFFLLIFNEKNIKTKMLICNLSKIVLHYKSRNQVLEVSDS